MTVTIVIDPFQMCLFPLPPLSFSILSTVKEQLIKILSKFQYGQVEHPN